LSVLIDLKSLHLKERKEKKKRCFAMNSPSTLKLLNKRRCSRVVKRSLWVSEDPEFKTQKAHYFCISLLSILGLITCKNEDQLATFVKTYRWRKEITYENYPRSILFILVQRLRSKRIKKRICMQSYLQIISRRHIQ